MELFPTVKGRGVAWAFSASVLFSPSPTDRTPCRSGTGGRDSATNSMQRGNQRPLKIIAEAKNFRQKVSRQAAKNHEVHPARGFDHDRLGHRSCPL